MTNDDRTTSEVMATLSADCDRCFEEMQTSIDRAGRNSDGSVNAEDYEYHARQFVRAVFAFIEATTFSVKAWSAKTCLDRGVEITPEERYFAVDMEFEIDEKGQVVETAAKIPLAKNVRFALSLSRRACGVAEPFDASVEWWRCLKSAIRIRDRLTHPKFPSDLDISGDDLITVVTAQRGFADELMRFADRVVPDIDD